MEYDGAHEWRSDQKIESSLHNTYNSPCDHQPKLSPMWCQLCYHFLAGHSMNEIKAHVFTREAAVLVCLYVLNSHLNFFHSLRSLNSPTSFHSSLPSPCLSLFPTFHLEYIYIFFLLFKIFYYILNIDHISLLSCFNPVWLFATHGLKSARLLCPWNSPGKNTEVGCHTFFQGIFLT